MSAMRFSHLAFTPRCQYRTRCVWNNPYYFRMTIQEFLQQSPLYNCIAVESIMDEKFRLRLDRITKYIISITALLLLCGYFFQFSGSESRAIAFLIPRLWGMIFIDLSLMLFSKLEQYYLQSEYYFEKITKNTYEKHELYTFSAGRILFASRKSDMLHGFIDSDIGMRTFQRLGLRSVDARTLYASAKIIPENAIPKSAGEYLKASDIAKYLYEHHATFSKFLNNFGITEKELLGALDIVIFEIEHTVYDTEWWRTEKLMKIKPIAEDWAFGKTYLLEQFARDIFLDAEVDSGIGISNRDSEVAKIETGLLKKNGANIMLVGEPGEDKMRVLWALARKIKNKTLLIPLLKKKIFLLETGMLEAGLKDKDQFEEMMAKIFLEIAKAGNVILAIDNFHALRKLFIVLGSDFENFIAQFLKNNLIHVIALVNTSDFHQEFENDNQIMLHFESILVQPLSKEEMIEIVAKTALGIEKRYDIFYTYEAIIELVGSAAYYFPNGVSSENSQNLLDEMAPWTIKRKKKNIEKNDVLEFIAQKTGIPIQTEINATDTEVLLNLEKMLSDRVIGQPEAITSIWNTLKRSRTSVRNPSKPIGSFLFLGPTGVGKTETAKALAYSYFKSESTMIRFDMSEFQGDNAMEKFIGSNTKKGLFVNALREKPYGVVLLDEFEKASGEILNIFLQIFDEGIFTDNEGKKVSARNIIFIATSNASAEKIFDLVSKGGNLKNKKEELIADIVSRGLLKAELINRFDTVTIFKPLETEDLKKIASLMLSKLSQRMIEKGITFEVTDDLVNYIVKNGSSKTFGARPMNRLIQDTVETKIADLILEKKISAGKNMSFDIFESDLKAKIS